MTSLGNNVNSNTNETTSLVKDITQTITVNDIKQDIVICRLSCHIIGNTSISYIMKVVDLDRFNENKDGDGNKRIWFF